MQYTVRSVTSNDHEAIDAAIKRKFWDSKDYQWLKYVCPEYVEAALKNKTSLISVIVQETYLVLVCTAQPWYTSRQFLQELLVLKLYDGPGKLNQIPKILKDMAKNAGMGGVMAGAAISKSPEALLEMYCRQGFELQPGSVFADLTKYV